MVETVGQSKSFSIAFVLALKDVSVPNFITRQIYVNRNQTDGRNRSEYLRAGLSEALLLVTTVRTNLIYPISLHSSAECNERTSCSYIYVFVLSAVGYIKKGRDVSFRHF